MFDSVVASWRFNSPEVKVNRRYQREKCGEETQLCVAEESNGRAHEVYLTFNLNIFLILLGISG